MRYARFTKPLTIAFQAEIYDQIKEISEETKRSMADIVREVMQVGLTYFIRDKFDVGSQD